MRPAHPRSRAAVVPSQGRCSSLVQRGQGARLRLVSLPVLTGYLFALLTVHATHTCHLTPSHSGSAAIPCCHGIEESRSKPSCNPIPVAEEARPRSTPVLLAGEARSGCLCPACLYLTEAMGDAPIPASADPLRLQWESLPHPPMPEPIRPTPTHPSSRDPPRFA